MIAKSGGNGCLDDAGVAVPVHPVEVRDGVVLVGPAGDVAPATSPGTPRFRVRPSTSIIDAPAPVAVDPLAGFTVGLTAARRADELGALFERRGATVVGAPAIRIVPLSDDAELWSATRLVIADPPQPGGGHHRDRVPGLGGGRRGVGPRRRAAGHPGLGADRRQGPQGHGGYPRRRAPRGVRDVGLKVLTGQGAAIDTTTAAGKLVFGIFAALAGSNANSFPNAPSPVWLLLGPAVGKAAAPSR